MFCVCCAFSTFIKMLTDALSLNLATLWCVGRYSVRAFCYVQDIACTSTAEGRGRVRIGSQLCTCVWGGVCVGKDASPSLL